MALVTCGMQPVIFQLVGYSNRGKTTLMTKLIEALSDEGYRVATLKHHGHGGKPEVLEKKDTSQHLQAGAIVSLVEGAGRILLQAEKQKWSIIEQIQLLSQLQPDFIIIEGHKHENYPKAVLIREPEDLKLLNELKNIVAVFYWDRASLTNNILGNHRAFEMNNEDGFIWLKEILIQMKNTNK